MKGVGAAFLRLLSVQGAWNYERMLGVGIGYAAEPLLADLKEQDPAHYHEAVARGAEFFNSHPYLAGLALGASVRAENDGVPGPQIARLRTALCSPLGALGDQIFWAGLLPALIGAALVAAALGAGLWAVVGFVAVYGTIRAIVTLWGLRTGLASGIRIASAIQASWLPRVVGPLGSAAGFCVGLAIPLVAAWLLEGWGARAAATVLAVATVGVLLSKWWGTTFTAVRFGLGTLALALLWSWLAR